MSLAVVLVSPGDEHKVTCSMIGDKAEVTGRLSSGFAPSLPSMQALIKWDDFIHSMLKGWNSLRYEHKLNMLRRNRNALV